MQVRDLVAFLQGLDQDAHVVLVAHNGNYDAYLDSEMLSVCEDGSVQVDLDDFVAVCAAI